MSSLLTVLISIAAIASTVMQYNGRQTPNREVRSPQPSFDPEWRKFTSEGIELADDGAAQTILLFSDFECPYCAKQFFSIDSVRTRGFAVRVIYRHVLNPGHRFARKAAIAGECAALQGRFREMSRVLFMYRDSLGIQPWNWYASLATLPDTLAFNTCLKTQSFRERFAADSAAAAALGVGGTPTMFIEGLRVAGAVPASVFESYLDPNIRKTFPKHH